MLHGLRQGAELYVFYKGELRYEILEVVSVSNPVPQFPTYTAGMPVAQPSRIVDIQARRGDETVKFEKVPADVPVADFGPTSGIVLSENRDAILAEIVALRKRSERNLLERPRDEKIVAECKRMEQELNPDLMREAQNTHRLDMMEQRLNGLSDGMSTLEGLMAEVRTLLKSNNTKKSKED